MGSYFRTLVLFRCVVVGRDVEEEVRRHDSKEEVTPFKGTGPLGFYCHSLSLRTPYPSLAVSAGSREGVFRFR